MIRGITLVAGASLASQMLASPMAAAPPAPDWVLLDVTGDATSALVIDRSSVVARRGGKQAKVAVIYDANSDIAAIEMTLVVDCATSREKAKSVRIHDQAGGVFPQGASGRFEPAETGQPWRKYLCPGVGAGVALASLGSQFPTEAVRRTLTVPGVQATELLGRAK